MSPAAAVDRPGTSAHARYETLGRLNARASSRVYRFVSFSWSFSVFWNVVDETLWVVAVRIWGF